MNWEQIRLAKKEENFKNKKGGKREREREKVFEHQNHFSPLYLQIKALIKALALSPRTSHRAITRFCVLNNYRPDTEGGGNRKRKNRLIQTWNRSRWHDCLTEQTRWHFFHLHKPLSSSDFRFLERLPWNARNRSGNTQPTRTRIHGMEVGECGEWGGGRGNKISRTPFLFFFSSKQSKNLDHYARCLR